MHPPSLSRTATGPGSVMLEQLPGGGKQVPLCLRFVHAFPDEPLVRALLWP